MISALTGLALPAWLDVLLVALLLLGLGFLIAYLGRWAFRLVEESTFVPRVARDFIQVAVETMLAALRERLAGFDPAAQALEVEATARAVYAALPEVISLSLRGRVLPVPLKLLISEPTFVNLALGALGQVDHLYDDLLARLTVEYEYWKKQGEAAAHG